MSVCASANPFNSRGPPVSSSGSGSGGRRSAPPLANDERWVALNKNIFQDILNAILIQTTFSSASAGKRHLATTTRPEVGLHHSPCSTSCPSSTPTNAIAASPLSFSNSDAVPFSSSATPNQLLLSGFKPLKDIVGSGGHRGTLFESTCAAVEGGLTSPKYEAPEESSNGGYPCEAATADLHGSVVGVVGGRSAGEGEKTFTGRGINERHPAPVMVDVKEQSLKLSGNSTGSGDEGLKELKGSKGSKGVSSGEVVYSTSSSRLRDKMSSAFSKVIVGASSSSSSSSTSYPRSSLLDDRHLSVYCEETYVGNVPMMIIGLRPSYLPPPPPSSTTSSVDQSQSKLSCLLEPPPPPTNQISLHSPSSSSSVQLRKCHTQISSATSSSVLGPSSSSSASSLKSRRSSGSSAKSSSSLSSSSLLFREDGRRGDDYYDRCAKMMMMTGKFLSPQHTQPTDDHQLHIDISSVDGGGAAGGGGGGGGGRDGQKNSFIRAMYYPEHHSESGRDGEPMRKKSSSLKLSPAPLQVQPDNEAVTGANTTRLMTTKAPTKTGASEGGGGGRDQGRKSSRDHSILTILGLLSSTQDDEDDEEEELHRIKQTKSSSSVGVKAGGCRGEAMSSGGHQHACHNGTGAGMEKSSSSSRLLGIGVTVIGRSRWMAVDKCIVYDMIDQVLNGEPGDYFSTDDDSSTPSLYSPSSSYTTVRAATSRPLPPQGVGTLVASPPQQMNPRRCGVVFSADGIVRKRSHHLPRTQRSGTATVLTPPRCMKTSSGGYEVKRKVESGIEGDLKQNHDMNLPPPPPPPSSSSSSSSSSFASTTTTAMASSFKPASGTHHHCESPGGSSKGDRLSSNSRSLLEGVSVLRSLLSDDPPPPPIDVCHGVGPSAVTEGAMTTAPPHAPPTTNVTTDDAKITPRGTASSFAVGGSGRVKAIDFSNGTATIDELRRVKRSRHNSVAEGKKRRVNPSTSVVVGNPSTTITLHLPSSSDTIPSGCSEGSGGSEVSGGSRSCSVPATSSTVASTMMTNDDHRTSKAFNAIKWKSNMLMRMRTEEGIDNDDEEEEEEEEGN